MDDHDFDVIVIGGGVAGLSGALTLARARRSVLILDAGEPRNAPAAAVHGFLSRDGIAPAELIGLGAAEVTGYGGQIISARATSARRRTGAFEVGTDGRTFVARRLLVTTGLVDELPKIPGLRQRWGRDVLHCPYCHGFEFRDQPIGVLGTGEHAVHRALLMRQWSHDVTLLRHTAPDPTPAEWEELAARGISVVEGEVATLQVVDDRLTGVRLAAGPLIPLRALLVMPHSVARSDALTGLGLAAVEDPRGIGRRVEADATGRTAVPGVWVAGNVTDLAVQIIGAAAAAVVAAAAINADLVADDTRRAVERRQNPFSGVAEARISERVLDDRRHGLTTVAL